MTRADHARRTVVLRHELPDGSWHFDWMLERDGAEERRLVAFRVGVRPDGDASGSCEGVRLADHRARYLDYEGPIGEGRGSVARLATGTVLTLDAGGSRLAATILWGDRTCRLEGERMVDGQGEGDRWLLRWGPV